jgi:soluble lytic murein transglycosylase
MYTNHELNDGMKRSAGKQPNIQRPTLFMAKLCLGLCFWLCFGLSLGLSLSSTASAAPAVSATHDTAFIAAREATRTGNGLRLGQAVAALPVDYVLRPWADYWQLRQQLAANAESGADTVDSSGIISFLQTHEGSYLAEKLRTDWLYFLGKKSDWVGFAREFPLLSGPDTTLDCYAAQAAGTPQRVRPLWLSTQEIPSACMPLVDQLAATGDLTTEEIWQRVRRTLALGKVGAGKTAAAYLPSEQNFERGSLEAIAADPNRYFKRLSPSFAATRRGREMALFAVQTLARSDVMAAAIQLRSIEQKLPAAEAHYAWGKLARLAAGKHLPEALTWYDLAAETPLDEEQMAWHVRAALRAHDWARVQRVIAAMPAEFAQRPEWIYWQARALTTRHQVEQANALFLRIAGQPTFYGQLAAEDLGWTTRLPLQAPPPSPEEIAAAENNPGLQRALELFRLDMRIEGVREWNWSLRGMNDRALLATAHLARRHAVWDRAISSADRTQDMHDFSSRYLAPYYDQVTAETTAQNVDTAWVYGLIRQESRFVTQANSAVGAKGLMQVMPATAQWVAKKIKLANFHPQHITDIETNVQLGVSYLKLVLESLDRLPVLASAAYNAGPNRARRWRGAQPLEGAIYAETIPFTETRDYVKKVMSNTMYYHLLFNSTPQSLKARLGIVQPAGVAMDAAVENLP